MDSTTPISDKIPAKRRIKKQYKTFKLYDCLPFDQPVPSPKDKDDGNDHGAKNWGPTEFCIELYGCNEAGEKCAIRVSDMRPYFFVKVARKWTPALSARLVKELKTKLPALKYANIVPTIVQAQPLGMFNNGELSTFVRLEFDNLRTFNQVQGLWYTGTFPNRILKPLRLLGMQVDIFEGKIPPILRFFHMNSISPTGWINICINQTRPPEEPFSNCEYEFLCKVSALTPLPDKIDSVPLLNLSYDIEASSSHGDFPVPIKDYKKPTIQILDHYSAKLEAGSDAEARVFVGHIVKKMFHLRNPLEYNAIDVVYPKQFPFAPVPKSERSLAEAPAIDESKVDDRGKYAELTCTKEASTWIKSVLQAFDSPISAIAAVISGTADSGQSGNHRAAAQRALLVGKQFGQLKDQNAPAKKVDASSEGEGEGDEDGEGEGDAPGKAPQLGLNMGEAEMDRAPDVRDEVGDDAQCIPDNILETMTKFNDPTSLTIYQVLASRSILRDRKILYINYLMTMILPPLEGDKVTLIGSSFIRTGQKHPESHVSLVLNSCDPVPGMDVRTFVTERDLLIAWADLIRESRPDIIYGYNNAGFDWPFLFARAQENDCVDDLFSISKRLGEVGVKTAFVKKDDPGDPPQTLDCTSVKLSAGEFLMYYPVLPGILQFDLLFYFRREFSNYSSYRLDDVAGINIRDKIDRTSRGASAPTMDPTKKTLRLHCTNVVGLYPGNYICLELMGITTSATFLTSEDGTKEKIFVYDIEYGPEGDVPGGDKIILIGAEYESQIRRQVGLSDDAPLCKMQWRVAKDDVTPQEIFKLSNGTDADRAIVAKYCRQDCDLPIILAIKTDMITGFFENANLCLVPVNFLVRRGQGIQLLSQFSLKCANNGIIMPDLGPEPVPYAFDGATVLDPRIQMYGKVPVGVNDFQSLYPSMASGYNLSHDSKVGHRDYDLTGLLIGEVGEKNEDDKSKPGSLFTYEKLPGREYVYTMYPRKVKVEGGAKSKKSIVVGYREVCWVLPIQGDPSTRGIVPKVIDELLKARADTRALGKIEVDAYKASIYDVRQLKYKVSCNSVYGQTGSAVSAFRCLDVAASITSIGRSMIVFTKAVVEQVYANRLVQTKNHGTVRTRSQYVYGDTDSVFFAFNLETIEGVPITDEVALEITIELANEVARMVTMNLPAPMGLMYEKTFMEFIILSKKRYIGILFEGKFVPGAFGKMKYMGLQMKKRDVCDCVKDVYGDIIGMFLKNATKVDIVADYLRDVLQKIIDGAYPLEKFGLTKSLKGSYKNPPAHYILANRIGEREPGTRPKPGDRIGYAFIVPVIKPGQGSGKGGKLLAGDKIETLAYIRAHGLRLDYHYYITNHIMNPLLQLLGLALVPFYRLHKDKKGEAAFHAAMQQIKARLPDDMEAANKAREAYCSAQIKKMFFDPFLLKLSNQSKGLRDISTFFLRPAAGATTTNPSYVEPPPNKTGDRSAKALFGHIRK